MANENLRTIMQPTQQEPLDARQVQNSAGGFSYAVSDWTRLERFLILGSEGGSYYATERKLTRENAQAVLRCIAADGPRAVGVIRNVSEKGRAPKNDYALWALAAASKFGDDETRRNAYAALQRVARTGTHLFQFLEYRKSLGGGWGRGMRGAVHDWYMSKSPRDLAYQLVKYRQREGWTHRDVMRLAHPHPYQIHGEGPKQRAELYGWAVNGTQPSDSAMITGFTALQECKEPGRAAALIDLYGLPREAVPTELLKSPLVWDALLHSGSGMPVHALVRNLANMTRCGLVAPASAAAAEVVRRLTDGTALLKSRLHPIAVLSALRTYVRGAGFRSDKTWTPVPAVADALENAFYACFNNVEPTRKRHMLALDCSGSMTSGEIAGVPGLTPMEASAAMLMVTARTELDWHAWRFDTSFRAFSVLPKDRLAEVTSRLYTGSFGGTDCSLPMLHALKYRREVDAFVVYTDSETWAGSMHSMAALRKYRDAMGIPAKLIVVGMMSNGFTIADPEDGGALDVVGFDTAAPAVMSDFIRGEF